jgi:hypothetical protein
MFNKFMVYRLVIIKSVSVSTVPQYEQQPAKEHTAKMGKVSHAILSLKDDKEQLKKSI